MKNKFKKAFISGAIMATGLVVGYAASTAIQDLDAIRDNFDFILNLNTSKQKEIDDLKTSKKAEIDALDTTIEDLEGQIAELKQTQDNSYKQEDIDALNTTIEDLNAQIEKLQQTQNNSGKQKEINELKEKVETLEAQIVEQTQNNSKIDELKKKVETLEAERDSLVTQYDNAVKHNSNLEAKITELLNHTNDGVKELTDGQ